MKKIVSIIMKIGAILAASGGLVHVWVGPYSGDYARAVWGVFVLIGAAGIWLWSNEIYEKD